MNRFVVMTILKICGKALLFTLIAGIIIGALGYVRKWDTSMAYSNAFFIAGCLMIVVGPASRLGAGEDWNTFQLLSAESFRNMSSGERANFITNTGNSLSLFLIGLLSGIVLIIISAVITRIF